MYNNVLVVLIMIFFICQIANNLVLIHGPDLKSEDARFTLSQLMDYKFESSRDFDFEAKTSCKLPVVLQLLNLVSKLIIFTL